MNDTATTKKKKAAKKPVKKRGTLVKGSQWTAEQIHEQNIRVFEYMVKGESMNNACKLAGVSMDTFYYRWKKDKNIQKKLDDAMMFHRLTVENTISKRLVAENKIAELPNAEMKDTKWWAERMMDKYADKRQITIDVRPETTDRYDDLNLPDKDESKNK